MPWPSTTVTHFVDSTGAGGPGNVVETNMFTDLPQPDPTRFHTYFEDFDYYTAADWTVTSTVTSTQALTSADGGVLLLTFTTNTDNGLIGLQKVGEDFLFESGKTFFFRTRLAINSISADFTVGLQVTDTTPLAVSAGVYFLKRENADTIDFVVRRNDTTRSTSAAAITTISANSYLTLSFYYDGGANFYYGAYDQVIGRVSATESLPTATLTPSFAIQNGGTGSVSAPSMSMDFIYAAKARTAASER